MVVSQRVLRVTLRKTFRNHVNEAGVCSSAAKLFTLKISLCNYARLLNTAAQLFRRNSDKRSERKMSSKGCINELRLQKWRWADYRQGRTNCIGKMRKLWTAGSNSE